MKKKENKITKVINKGVIISFILGVVITSIVAVICWPKRIAKLKSGEEVAIIVGNTNITADDVYTHLKEKNSINAIFELVDSLILNNKYKLTDEDKDSINSNANYYYEQYANYGYSKEDFLKNNGFDDEKAFIDYLTLDYLRQMYYKDYLKSLVTEEDIEEYYEDNVFTPFNVEHMLVSTSSISETEAKALANEIIGKLNSGASWDSVKNEYSSYIISESFKVDFTSNLEESFLTASVKLSEGAYSTSPVQTSYGYHVIYKKQLLNRPTKEEAREDIINNLSASLSNEEKYSYENVLVTMREVEGMDIKDSEMNKIYNNYVKSLKED